MIEILGILGSLLLALCALPEALRAYRTGKCDVGYGLLNMWLIGEVLLLIYNTKTHDLVLYGNYVCNIGFLLVLYKYKLFPKESI